MSRSTCRTTISRNIATDSPIACFGPSSTTALTCQEYWRADAGGYERVNHLFADHLSALINEDDVIWVHDYHLLLLARELRSRGHRNRIGFFLHTPCAPPDILQTLPHHRGILGGLTYCDLVGIPDRKRSRQFRPVSGGPGRDADARRLRDRRPAGPARRLSGEHRNEGVHAPCAQRGALTHGCSRARESRRKPPRAQRRSAGLFEGHSATDQGVRTITWR